MLILRKPTACLLLSLSFFSRPPASLSPMPRLLAAALLLFSVVSSPATDWIEYSGCRLSPGAYHDGDSFSRVEGLKIGGKRASKTNWRLYGVDCVETDDRNPDRLHEQAKAFGVPESALRSWGKKASEFSAKFLSEPFRVMTIRENAWGASEKNRYYAIIIGADGRLLHEALLEAGLARAHGMPVAWPKKTSATDFEARLKSLERTARARKAGIWGG